MEFFQVCFGIRGLKEIEEQLYLLEQGRAPMTGLSLFDSRVCEYSPTYSASA